MISDRYSSSAVIMLKTVTVKTRILVNVMDKDRPADLEHRPRHAFADLFPDIREDKALGVVVGTQHQFVIALVEKKQRPR